MSKRQSIVEAAREAFLEEGFDAVAMERVAATANVSKVTVYRHFKDKEALLEAVMAAHGERAEFGPMGPLPLRVIGLRATLLLVGDRMREFLDRDDIVRIGRLVASQAERHPELARRYYRSGAEFGLASVAGLLEEAMALGMMPPADPRLAAERFIALCGGLHDHARSLGVTEALSPEARLAAVTGAVDAFGRIYGPFVGEG